MEKFGHGTSICVEEEESDKIIATKEKFGGGIWKKGEKENTLSLGREKSKGAIAIPPPEAIFSLKSGLNLHLIFASYIYIYIYRACLSLRAPTKGCLEKRGGKRETGKAKHIGAGLYYSEFNLTEIGGGGEKRSPILPLTRTRYLLYRRWINYRRSHSSSRRSKSQLLYLSLIIVITNLIIRSRESLAGDLIN